MTRPDPRQMPVGPVDALRSAALWGAGLSWLVPMLSVMGTSTFLVDPDRLEWLSRLYCWGQVKTTGSTWRAVVHPDVDSSQPYLFAQNHVNLLDHVTLYNATPHFKQGVELESHFKIPFYGWFMKARGTIGVRPGKQGQTPEIMAHAQSEIDKGHSILAFPEGTRTLDGRVGPFRKGTFFIARDLGIPVAPVAVCGMFHVLRKGSWVMRPYDVTVYVEKPIPTIGVQDHEMQDFADEVQRVVARRVDAWWAGEEDHVG